jgi:hypothetical protein
MGQNKHSTTPDDVSRRFDPFGLGAALAARAPFDPDDYVGDEPEQALDPAGAARWAWRLLGSGVDPRQVEALKSGPSLAGLARIVPCERLGATEPGDRPSPGTSPLADPEDAPGRTEGT